MQNQTQPNTGYCMICMNESMIMTQTCGDAKHEICVDCKQKWLQKSKKCPQCRAVLLGYEQEAEEEEWQDYQLLLFLQPTHPNIYDQHLFPLFIEAAFRVLPIIQEEYQLDQDQSNQFISGWISTIRDLNQQYQFQLHPLEYFKYTEIELFTMIRDKVKDKEGNQIHNMTYELTQMTDQQLKDIILQSLTKPLEEYIEIGQTVIESELVITIGIDIEQF